MREESQPDFRVSYKWCSDQKPYQHMRCDFAYAGDDITHNDIYKIHPEFERAPGDPYGKDEEIPKEGIASMWIISDTMRSEVHAQLILEGTLGHFMDGLNKLGEVKVIETLRLRGCRPR